MQGLYFSHASRLSRVVAGLLGLVLCLGGCGVKSQVSAAPTTLSVWYSTDDPVERAWSQQLARRFERSHPDIRIQLTDYSFEDMNTKLQLALSAGNPPDLAYVTPRGPGIPAYVGAHTLRDLTPAARRYGWASRLRSGLLASYNQPFAYFGAKRESVVAAPMALAAVGVLYNRRLLRRLHLPVPASLAQFESELPRIRSAGYTPLGMGNGDGWLGDDWYLTLVNAMVSPATLQPEQNLDPRFTFRRSAFLKAARTVQRWAQEGYFTHDFGGLDAQEGVDLFFRGRTAFQLISSSENSQIMQDERQTRLPIGVFAFPSVSGGRVVPMSGYEGWVVPSAGKHPAQAERFIDDLLSPSTAAFLLDHGVLPAQRTTGAAGERWQAEQARTVNDATPGVYLDAAPVSNLNATMEANVQLLLQGYEPPQFLVNALEQVYSSHGKRGSTARIDGEF